jgi:hypothetical protein
MLAEVAGVEEYWEEDLTHAFCVNTRQSDKVAGMVLSVLQQRGVLTHTQSQQASAGLLPVDVAVVSRL